MLLLSRHVSLSLLSASHTFLIQYCTKYSKPSLPFLKQFQKQHSIMVRAGSSPEKRDAADNSPKASTYNKASNPPNNHTNLDRGPTALNATANEFKPRTKLNLTSEPDAEEAVDSPLPLQRTDTNPYSESHPVQPIPVSRPSGRHDLEAAFETATAAYAQDIRRTSSLIAPSARQTGTRISKKEPPIVIKEEEEEYLYPVSLPFPAPCPRMNQAWQAGKECIAEAIRASYRASCDATGKGKDTRL